MKITDILNSGTKGLEMNQRESIEKGKGIKTKFSEELHMLKGLSAKEKLSVLLERIDKQADRLSKNIDIKEVIVYKKLISEFLKESVDSMVKFSKTNFLDRRGRHRVYAIIKRVDTELEELTKDVLNNEKDNIKVVKRLDDIRGLILDIYM